MKWTAGMHWAYSSKAWCGLFATLRDGRVMCRHELTWIRTPPEQAARELKAFCAARKIQLNGVVAQPEIFPKPTGPRGETVSETFQRAGVPMRRGDGDRLNGWSRVRSWLQPIPHADGTVGPSLLFHKECVYLLRTLPTLVSAGDNPDDVDECPDEFPANGVRYFVMSRPMPNEMTPQELPDGAIGHELRALREELAASWG